DGPVLRHPCMLPNLHGPSGIRRPLAPRSGIELCALEACVLQREEVVARRDAGAAVTDDVIGGGGTGGGTEVRAGRFRRAERAAFVEIPSEEMIHRAGNVSGLLVDRLALAAIPLGRARVDEAPLRIA